MSDKFRNKIRQLLTEAPDQIGGSNIPSNAQANVVGQDVAFNTPQRQSTRDNIFKMMADTGDFENKVKEVLTLADKKKLKRISAITRQGKLLKDEGEDYLEALEDFIADRKQSGALALQKVNNGIKKYNTAVESQKNAFGVGLATGYLTIPELRSYEDFGNLQTYLANAPHILQNLLPLHGLDISGLADEEAEVSPDVKNTIDSLGGTIQSSNLPPKAKAGLRIRLKTATRNVLAGKTKLKTSKGTISIKDFISLIKKDFDDLQDKLTEAAGINAPNPEKAKDTILRYFKWLTNAKNYNSITVIQEAITELLSGLEEMEVNSAVLKGLEAKANKIRNLRSRKPTVVSPGIGDDTKVAADAPELANFPLEVESLNFSDAEMLIVLDPSDYSVEGIESILSLDDIIAEINASKDGVLSPDPRLNESVKKENVEVLMENENKQPEFKRTRRLSRKGLLEEAWKNNKNKILKQDVDPAKENNDQPNIHLGGL